MVIMDRDVAIALTVDAIYWEDMPKIRVEFNGQVLIEQSISDTEKWSWLLPAKDINRFSIWMLNKTDADTTNDGRDKAVVVRSFSIEGFAYDSFRQASRYRPIYSQGYEEYARRNGIAIQSEINSNYLGFNGEWWVEWPWPTFSWIYDLETQGLGWVYEKNI